MKTRNPLRTLLARLAGFPAGALRWILGQRFDVLALYPSPRYARVEFTVRARALPGLPAKWRAWDKASPRVVAGLDPGASARVHVTRREFVDVGDALRPLGTRDRLSLEVDSTGRVSNTYDGSVGVDRRREPRGEGPA